MTLAARVGFESALVRLRDRDLLLAFVVGLAVSICWRDPGGDGSFSQLSADLFRERSGIGAAELLALAVLATSAFRFGRESLLTRSDLGVIAIASLAFALPLRSAASIPLTLVGIKLAFGTDPRVRSFGQILLALAFYEWIGPLIFHLLSPWVLKAETVAVQAVLAPIGGFARDGLIISPGSGHFKLMIEEGCSAFHNVSLASLIWISLVKLETLTLRTAHLWICAAMAAATVVLNTARLALMAQSYPMYEFWHNGAGVPIVSAAMLGAMLIICLGGLRITARP
jgi:hypothetical protein